MIQKVFHAFGLIALIIFGAMDEKRKYCFIVNPVSGKGKGREIIPFIEHFFKNKHAELKIQISGYPGESVEIARKAIAEGFHVIVAVGGDGTVNEIASTVAHSNSILGIIPIGSGNGLAREMQIPQDYKNAVRNLISGSIVKTDTALANNHFFACTAGIGFDAHLANKFLRTENRGFQGYVKIFLSEYFNYKSKTYSLKTENSETTEEAWLITIANHRQWGNNFYISPLSKHNDGLLEVCVLKKFPIYVLPIMLWRILFRSMHKSGYFKTSAHSFVKITSPDTGVFHTDGEIKSFVNTLEIAVFPGSLSIISGK